MGVDAFKSVRLHNYAKFHRVVQLSSVAYGSRVVGRRTVLYARSNRSNCYKNATQDKFHLPKNEIILLPKKTDVLFPLFKKHSEIRGLALLFPIAEGKLQIARLLVH